MGISMMLRTQALALLIFSSCYANIFDDIKKGLIDTGKKVEKPFEDSFNLIQKKYDELKTSIDLISKKLEILIDSIKSDVLKSARLIDGTLIPEAASLPKITKSTLDPIIRTLQSSVSAATKKQQAAAVKIQSGDLAALPEFVVNSQELISDILTSSVSLIDATFDKIPWNKTLGTSAQVIVHISDALLKITQYMATLTDDIFGQLLEQKTKVVPALKQFEEIADVLTKINRFSSDLANLMGAPS